MLYLDYNATCPVNDEVLDVFNKVIKEYFANPNALHKLGQTGEKLVNRSRFEIASLVGVKENEIVFTSGATEANNMAIKGVAFKYQNRGRHLITTEIEHSSVYEVFKYLEERFDFEITYVKVNEDGIVDLNDLKNAIRPDTILVSIMLVNSEVGSIQPIYEIGTLLKEYPKIIYHVDATQGLGKIPFDIKKANIDLLSFSAHKIGGIPNIGFLYKRENLIIDPLLNGGAQEQNLRAGTQSTALMVSLAKALKIALDKQKKELDRMYSLHNLMRNELSKIDGVVINTPTSNYSPFCLNVSVPALKAETVLHSLEKYDIYISTQSACSSKNLKISRVLKAMGKEDEIAKTSLRISTYYNITEDNIVYFINSFKAVIDDMRKVV